MDQDNVAIRLKGFIDHEGLTHSQFADRCGIPRPSLSQILSGRNKKISDVIVGQIHKTFPQLSVLWLMFGEGPMIAPVFDGDDGSDGSAQSLFPDEGLFSDNVNFATTGSENDIQQNLSALKHGSEPSKSSRFQQVDSNLQILELQKQIDNFRRNPRKVTQITVYYDDSTFETFVPKS